MKDDDFNWLRGFADERTNGRTDEQTFVIVESLSRLKKWDLLLVIVAVNPNFLGGHLVCTYK